MHRYYDPKTGRYLRPDPLGFMGGDANLYAYVQNNPTNLTDPEGLWIPQLVGGIIGASINAWNSRDLLSQGEYLRYALSIGSGAFTGVLSTFGGNLFAGMLWGVASGELNALADHVIRRNPCEELSIEEIDVLSSKMIKAGIYGGVGGFVGVISTQLGRILYLPGMRNLTSAQSGAITGIVSSSTASVGLGLE